MNRSRLPMFLSTEGSSPAGGAPASPAPSPTPAASPSAPAASPTADFRVPQGYSLVREDEYKQHTTRAQRLSELGLHDDTAYNSTKALFEAAKSKNLGAAELAQLLGGPTKKPETPQNPAAFDQAKFREELMAEFETKSKRESALADFNTRQAATSKWIDEQVKNTVGDDEVMGPILRDALEHRLRTARNKSGVPDGHPLHGYVSGLYSDELLAELAKSHADLPTKLGGWKFKAIAAAVNAGATPTAGGNKSSSAGGGDSKGEAGPKAWNTMTRAEREAWAKKRSGELATATS